MTAATSMTLALKTVHAADSIREPITRDRLPPLRSRGFALIELLVVVAVIATLLAILMPALNRARAPSKRVVSGGNLRPLTVARNNYLTNNNGLFCQGINANINHGG